MRKRSIIILLVLIAVCIAANIWSAAARAEQALTFTVPPIRVASAVLFTPLLWVCVGTLIGVLLAQNFAIAGVVKRILMIAGGVLLAVYICLAIWWAAAAGQGPAFAAFYWCVTHAAVLAAPGLLLGLSVRAEKTAQS